jgi:hypothetical protein
MRRRTILKSIGASGLALGGLGGAGSVAMTQPAAAATGSVIDDFDDGDLSEYTVYREGPATVVSSPTYSGSGALAFDSTSADAVSMSGLANYPTAGDTFSTRVRWTPGANGAVFAYGIQSYVEYGDQELYYVLIKPDADQIALKKKDLSGKTKLEKNFNVGMSADTWYNLEVDWQTDGTHTVTLYNDADGQVTQLSSTDTTWTDGGVGFYGRELNSAATVYFDEAVVDSAPAELGPIPTERTLLLDDFSDRQLSEYETYREESAVEFVSAPTFYGSTALSVSGDSAELISTSGLGIYPRQGDTFACRIRWTGNANALRFNYGVQDRDNRYMAIVSPDNDIVRLIREKDNSRTKLDAAFGVTDLHPDTWYEIRVRWSVGGDHNVKVLTTDDTVVCELTGQDDTWSSGGFGFDGMEFGTGATDYFDAPTLVQSTYPNRVTISNESQLSLSPLVSVDGALRSDGDSKTFVDIAAGETTTVDFDGNLTAVDDGYMKFTVDQSQKSIHVEDLDASNLDYEIEVTGTLARIDSSNNASVNGGIASGTLDGSTDSFEFTGDVERVRHVSVAEFDIYTGFRRVADHPYPDESVARLAIEYVEDPNHDRVAFTTTALEDGYGLYLARGAASVSDIPDEIVRLTEGTPAGNTELEWSSDGELRYWQNAALWRQQVEYPTQIRRPIPYESKPQPGYPSRGDN